MLAPRQQVLGPAMCAAVRTAAFFRRSTLLPSADRASEQPLKKIKRLRLLVAGYRPQLHLRAGNVNQKPCYVWRTGQMISGLRIANREPAQPAVRPLRGSFVNSGPAVLFDKVQEVP